LKAGTLWGGPDDCTAFKTRIEKGLTRAHERKKGGDEKRTHRQKGREAQAGNRKRACRASSRQKEMSEKENSLRLE
jgi:hypothetical protein